MPGVWGQLDGAGRDAASAGEVLLHRGFRVARRLAVRALPRCPRPGVPGHGLMGARVRPLRRGASADGASVAGHRPSPPAGVVSARGSDGDDGGHGVYDTTRVANDVGLGEVAPLF